jgi:hypothetical protein
MKRLAAIILAATLTGCIEQPRTTVGTEPIHVTDKDIKGSGLVPGEYLYFISFTCQHGTFMENNKQFYFKAEKGYFYQVDYEQHEYKDRTKFSHDFAKSL